MHQRTRTIFRVLLAIVMLVAGRTVALCACDAAGHGLFCADESAGHCGPTAAAPVETASSCCGGDEALAPEPRYDGLELAAGPCECPELDLSLPPAEVESASSRASALDELVLAQSHVDVVTDDVAAEAARTLARWDADPPRARRSSLRRHLELHVLRC